MSKKNNSAQSGHILEAMGVSLNESLDIEKVLQSTVDQACKLIPTATRSVFHLLDESTNTLKPISLGGFIQYGEASLFMHPGEGVAGDVFLSGRLANVPDVTVDNRFTPSNNQSLLRSLLVAPVRGKERTFGTISIHSDKPHAFNPKDEEALTYFAQRASIAIENAWLYGQENRNRLWAEALAEASALMTRSLDPDIVLDTILEQVAKVTSTDGQDIMFLDGDEAVMARHHGYEGEIINLEANKQVRLPASLSTFQQVRQTGQPFVSPNIKEILDWETRPGSERIRSYVCLPLKTAGDVIGFLNVVSQRESFFDANIVLRLRIFADHASIALYNARLHEEMKEALQHETMMRNRMIQNEHLASMGRMVSLVAHALNNPLQAIVNSIFLIEMDIPAGSPIHEYLSILTSDVNRLSDLVAQLRQVYKPSVMGEKQKIGLAQVLQETLALIEPQLVAKHMVLHQDKIPDEIITTGIPPQLRQLFLNICINAIEAMESQKNGKLFIAWEMDQENHMVGVSFNDTGKGIDPRFIDKLFDPYCSTKETKIGLGLTVCDEIIQQHEGRIDVKSQLGQGSTFTVWLPLAD